MTNPLEGIKVVEISMWAYVPSAGAVGANKGSRSLRYLECCGGSTFSGMSGLTLPRFISMLPIA